MPEIITQLINILDDSDESRLQFIGFLKQLFTFFNANNSYDQFKSYMNQFNLNFQTSEPTNCEKLRLEDIENAEIISYFLQHRLHNSRIEELLMKYGYIGSSIDISIPQINSIS